MAKLLGPAFRRGMAVAGTMVALAGPARVSLRIVESVVFTAPATNPVYLGATGRAVRYVGARSDAQIYLGARTLF